LTPPHLPGKQRQPTHESSAHHGCICADQQGVGGNTGNRQNWAAPGTEQAPEGGHEQPGDDHNVKA